jgi:hypothetical protein
VDLEQFVKQALSEIVLGVNAAQDHVEARGARINPAGVGPGAAPDGYLGQLSSGETVFAVDFDVAVTVSGGAPGEVGTKLQVLGLFTPKLGGAKRTPRDSTSRIKFRVPLALRLDSASKAAFDERLQKANDALDRWSRTEP